MPRKGSVVTRVIAPDPKFGDREVSRLIGALTRKGKRSVAESVCYGALNVIQTQSGSEPLQVFRSALENVEPYVEVKSRRVGGASYQVPIEVRPYRRVSLALRWIMQHAKKRSGKSMKEKLAAELLDASRRTGGAVKKKEDTHKMAEANKAFAAYRW